MLGKIFDIKKFALHDGPGIRTTVFFQGCSLDCWWCHNPEGKEIYNGKSTGKTENLTRFRFNKKQPTILSVTTDSLMEEIKKDLVFYEQSGGGVTFSGGEPMLQVDFLKEMLGQCHKHNIHTVIDTCGNVPAEDFERIYELVDIFLYDIKLIDNIAHRKYVGASNDIILNNLRLLIENDANINIRIPLIPGLTDTDQNLDDIIRLLNEIRFTGIVSLLRYNMMAEDKFRRYSIENRIGHFDIQTDEQIKSIGERFISHGLEIKTDG